MNNDSDEKIIHAAPVPPFVKFVASSVPMVFDNSLSYYEALCALWKWLQDDVIDVINNNASVTELWRQELTTFEDDLTDDFNDLSDAFNTLQTWIDNYFDNLDVQEEINNKLDAMAESGVLQEIIYQFLQSNVAWTFDTVADMKLSTNLIAGSYARTLGFHTLGDGGGAIYKISDSGTANEMDVIEVGSLYANLVLSDEITPEMVGAYGDGTHNDKLSLQRAISIANTVVLNKSYLTDAAITVDKPMTISGKGSITGNKISVASDNVTLKDFSIIDSTADGVLIDSVNNVTVSNLTLDTLNGCGVLVNTTTSDAENIIVENCKIYKPSQGADADYSPIAIYFASGDVNQVKNSKIINCYLEDCGYIGIFPNGFNNIVDGCTVNGSGKVKSSAASGIWLHDASDITVTNSTFTKCNSYAVRASKARNITINNCIITENLQYGVGFVYDGNATGKYQGETANQNVLLTNCRIYDNSTSNNNTFYGIYVGGYNDVTISDCEVFSLSGHQGRPVYEASESSHASTNLKIVDCKFYGSNINTILLNNKSALNRSTYRSGTKENDSWIIPVSGTSATITLPPNTDYVTVHTTQALPMDMGIGVTRYTEQVKAIGTSVYHGIYSIQITNAGVVTLTTLSGYAVNTETGVISAYTPDTNNLRSIEVKVNN